MQDINSTTIDGYQFRFPKFSVSMLGYMGVSCSAKTTRNIIKKAGMNSDMLIKSVVEFQKEGPKTAQG